MTRWLARVAGVALVIASIAIVIAGLAIWGTLRTYQVLTRRDVIAVVECWPSPTRPDEFRLAYRPMVLAPPVERTRGRAPKPARSLQLGPAQVYQLYGDQWSLGADLIVWRGWAQLLGARTWYKVTRLEGRYAAAARANAAPHLAYDVNGGSDWLWRAVYRYQAWLPSVEAAYGGSVYLPPNPDKRFVVYATPSGLLVRPQRRAPSQS